MAASERFPNPFGCLFSRETVVCALVGFAAFLPLAGLTLLSPSQTRIGEWREFLLASSLLCRFLTPVAAAVMLVGLARRCGLLSSERTIWKVAFSYALPGMALALAINVFTLFSLLLLILPGVGFLLGSCIALPILVVEQTSMTKAVLASWQRTLDHRPVLARFWVVFAGLAGLMLVAVLLGATGGQPGRLLCAPLAQSEALLPLTVVLAYLYSATVVASFRLYRWLSGPGLPPPSPPQAS